MVIFDKEPNNRDIFSSDFIDITELTVGFYLLDAVNHELQLQDKTFWDEVFRPKSKMFYAVKRFEAFRQDYNDNFARVLFEYLVITAFGEARHAQDKTSAMLEDYTPNNLRNTVWKSSINYAPEESLNVLYKLFNDYTWGVSYGGSKWAKIVKSASLYYELPTSVFIDHIIDMYHNGDIVWSKDLLFSGCKGLIHFLNWKKINYDFLYSVIRWGVNENILNIVKELKIVDFQTDQLDAVNNELPYQIHAPVAWPSPIKWGDNVPEIYENNTRHTCSNCGCYISKYDVYFYDEDYYCSSCFYDNFSTCEKCNETYAYSDLTTVEDKDYCEDCYNEIFTECEWCHASVQKDYTKETEEYEHVCASCYDEEYQQCESCNKTIHKDEVVIYEGVDYCEDCAKEVKFNASQMEIPFEEKLEEKTTCQFGY